MDYWGTNTWEDGDISGHKWLVLNGAWDEDWDQVDGRRRYLENLIDDILCDIRPVKGNAIVNHSNDKCLHVDGDENNPDDYTTVNVEDCNDGNGQKWELSEGKILHVASGKCLDMDANNG